MDTSVGTGLPVCKKRDPCVLYDPGELVLWKIPHQGSFMNRINSSSPWRKGNLLVHFTGKFQGYPQTVINKVTRIQSVLFSVLLGCGLHSQAGCPPEVSPGESRMTCSKSINSSWENVFLLSSNKRQVLGYLGLVQVICPSCNRNPRGPWSDWIGLDSAFIPRGGRWGKLDENCVYR